MFVTFKNCSTSENMIVSVNNQVHFIEPGKSTDVLCQNANIIFEVKTTAIDELTNFSAETDEEVNDRGFKDKILTKLTEKFIQKLPEAVLDTSVRYELCHASQANTTVNLYDTVYSVCDGKFADFLDLTPVGYVFTRAEVDFGEVKVLDAFADNRQKFLKLMRKILLFAHWNIFFVELFFFIPEYSLLKFYSSHFYIKKFMCDLYNKTMSERALILAEKEKSCDEENKKKGCLGSILKILLVLLILGGICVWSMSLEPDVIVSEDFSSVVCFDETFVRFEGGLPENAEDVFLEDYYAYYPLDDEGEYDMDNYYCYIYETSDGTRYMWLKDDCTNPENSDKEYKDYKNPLVYKSIGEQ